MLKEWFLGPVEVKIELAEEDLYCQNPNCKEKKIKRGEDVLIGNYQFFHVHCSDYANKVSKVSKPLIHPYSSAQAVLRNQKPGQFSYKLNKKDHD